LTAFSFVGFGTGWRRCKEAMKTASRENPQRWVVTPSSRAHGAEDQNRSCLNRWAAKQGKLQPLEWCFFLTSPFIELIGHDSRTPIQKSGVLEIESVDFFGTPGEHEQGRIVGKKTDPVWPKTA
jgi:hypothetical protein